MSVAALAALAIQAGVTVYQGMQQTSAENQANGQLQQQQGQQQSEYQNSATQSDQADQSDVQWAQNKQLSQTMNGLNANPPSALTAPGAEPAASTPGAGPKPMLG